MRYPVIGILLLVLGTAACKKEQGGGGSADLLDSSLLIAREYYLWYNQIPATFSSAQYGDPNALMQAIRAYSSEPGFNAAVDHWSFGMLQSEWNDVSGGLAGDLGIGVFFHDENDLRVSYVEPASVAGKAGVQRSWRITRINGRTDITATESSINFIVDAIYGGTAATIGFEKPDGTGGELNLVPGTYQEQPILLDTVYEAGAKKIGYLVLNSFLGNIDNMKKQFARSFEEFAANGATDLIIDLRYNGGGYVALQEELANYLVPSAKDKSLMYREQLNDKLSDLNSSADFGKKGTVEPKNIVFIISQNSASASEALINIMRPQLNVKLVGPSRSSGKPVGFFPIPVGDWYAFPVSLRIINANGEGNYFGGFTPDKVVADGLDKAWGDLSEDCLKAAHTYLGTGSFRSSEREAARSSPARIHLYNQLHVQKPSLLLENRIGH